MSKYLQLFRLRLLLDHGIRKNYLHFTENNNDAVIYVRNNSIQQTMFKLLSPSDLDLCLRSSRDHSKNRLTLHSLWMDHNFILFAIYEYLYLMM